MWIRQLGMIVLVWTAVGGSAAACSCTPTPPSVTFLEQLSRFDAVFSAQIMSERVTGKRDSGGMLVADVRHFTAEVHEVWKGTPRRTVQIVTTAPNGLCGYAFRAGETYVIWAQFDKEGQLWAGLCTPTRPLRDAAKQIEELGAPDHALQWPE